MKRLRPLVGGRAPFRWRGVRLLKLLRHHASGMPWLAPLPSTVRRRASCFVEQDPEKRIFSPFIRECQSVIGHNGSDVVGFRSAWCCDGGRRGRSRGYSGGDEGAPFDSSLPLGGSVWVTRARAWLVHLDEIEDRIVGADGGDSTPSRRRTKKRSMSADRGSRRLHRQSTGAKGLASLPTSDSLSGSMIESVPPGVATSGAEEEGDLLAMAGEPSEACWGSAWTDQAKACQSLEEVEGDEEDELGRGEGERLDRGEDVRPYSFPVLPPLRPSFSGNPFFVSYQDELHISRFVQ